MENNGRNGCCGALPANAPLANPYVPFQPNGAEQYSAKTGLIRGTMYPCLELPFLGMVNTEEKPDTMMHQLQALGFAVQELGLYLDTHADDRDAFELYQAFLAMQKEAHERYAARFGPICQKDMLGMDAYCWLRDPWPWEYPGRRES